MGWIGIAHSCIAYSIGLWSAFQDPPFRSGLTMGMSLIMALPVLLFASMIRVSTRLQSDLATVYSRARWIGLLAGAYGFPILTIPAFYAVRLIARARPSTQSGVDPSVATEAAN
jgi:hypothetical protein